MKRKGSAKKYDALRLEIETLRVRFTKVSWAMEREREAEPVGAGH